MQLQSALVQDNGLGAAQLSGVLAVVVSLQKAAVQHQSVKALHGRQGVVACTAADLGIGHGGRFAGAGQLDRSAHGIAAGYAAGEGQVAAANLTEAEGAAVDHLEGMTARIQRAQAVIRVEIGYGPDGERGLQGKGVRQVHAVAGKINEGGLVGGKVLGPDHQLAGVQHGDGEGAFALGCIDRLNGAGQVLLVLGRAAAVLQQGTHLFQTLVLADALHGNVRIVLEGLGVGFLQLVGGQIERHVLGAAEGGSVDGRAIHPACTGEGEPVGQAGEGIGLRIAVKCQDGELLQPGKGERIAAEAAHGNLHTGEAGAVFKDAEACQVRHRVFREEEILQRGAIAEGVHAIFADAGGSGVHAGEGGIAVKGFGGDLGHIVPAALIFQPVGDGQFARNLRAVLHGQGAVLPVGRQAGYFVGKVADLYDVTHSGRFGIAGSLGGFGFVGCFRRSGRRFAGLRLGRLGRGFGLGCFSRFVPVRRFRRCGGSLLAVGSRNRFVGFFAVRAFGFLGGNLFR